MRFLQCDGCGEPWNPKVSHHNVPDELGQWCEPDRGFYRSLGGGASEWLFERHFCSAECESLFRGAFAALFASDVVVVEAEPTP